LHAVRLATDCRRVAIQQLARRCLSGEYVNRQIISRPLQSRLDDASSDLDCARMRNRHCSQERNVYSGLLTWCEPRRMDRSATCWCVCCGSDRIEIIWTDTEVIWPRISEWISLCTMWYEETTLDKELDVFRCVPHIFWNYPVNNAMFLLNNS